MPEFVRLLVASTWNHSFPILTLFHACGTPLGGARYNDAFQSREIGEQFVNGSIAGTYPNSFDQNTVCGERVIKLWINIFEVVLLRIFQRCIIILCVIVQIIVDGFSFLVFVHTIL